MEHGTNVVVVSIQSNSSFRILLFADWLFTTTTFIPTICLSLILIYIYISLHGFVYET